MKRNLWVVILLLVLFLPACATSAPATEEIDLATLPRDVDVQTVQALLGREDVLMIDVREQYEYDEGHIPGITLIPMSELPDRLDEIPADVPVILACRSGNRSNQMALYLEQQGFDNIHNMLGGILAWEQAGYKVDR
jgi:rhodanese-related sulfurtransferase